MTWRRMRPEVVPFNSAAWATRREIRVGHSLRHLPDLRDLRLAVRPRMNPSDPLGRGAPESANGLWSVPPTESETQISQIAQRASPTGMVAVRQGSLKRGRPLGTLLGYRGMALPRRRLLGPERHRRINPRRATRRDARRQQRHQQQDRGDRAEHDRVRWAHVVELRA
jgi:hypothetical protein